MRIGIEEADDGNGLVGPIHCVLGHIDLEQRTSQTIDNPLGTRLSPMSWEHPLTHVSGEDTRKGWRTGEDSNP